MTHTFVLWLGRDMTDGPSIALDRDVSRLWTAVIAELDGPSRAIVSSCVPLTMHESTLMIAAPNEFTRDRLENRLRGRIEAALSDALGEPAHIGVTIDQSCTRATAGSRDTTPPTTSRSSSRAPRPAPGTTTRG
jgi:chromosomal replication initiation ATPase DnaA